VIEADEDGYQIEAEIVMRRTGIRRNG